MVQKCGIREITVMEVGVRTRSRARIAMAAKKRTRVLKPPREFLDREIQISCSSSEIADDCCSDRIEEAREEDDRLLLDLEFDEGNETETSTCNTCQQRREMTLSSKLGEISDGVELTSKPTVDNLDRRSSSSSSFTDQKMPSEKELEDFFAAAEKNVQTRFAKKYNYDIVKDTPLEGRYEWVRLKP